MFKPVRGTHDLYGDDCQKYLNIISKSRAISKLYNYEEIITPIFEFSDVFQRLGETSDIISKETYTFTDRGGDSLTLRPEGTAPIVRAAISNGLIQHLPLRFFSVGPMFRYERPQKGRYRQFDQLNIELCGIEEAQGDVEVITLGAHILNELGVLDQTSLEINTLGDTESRNAYRNALITYFSGHKDSLSPESILRLEKNPLRLLDSKDEKDQDIAAEAPSFIDYLTDISKKHFDDVLQGLDNLHIAYKVNHRIVRGLDYYCHTAFEFVSQELGAQSAVMAGGRYNGLFKEMGGPPIPGVGWGSGIQRLMMLSAFHTSQSILFSLISLGDETQKIACQMAYELRNKGLMIDLDVRGSLSKGLKRAQKIGAHSAILLGEDEVKEHSLLVRDLTSGVQQKVNFSHLSEFLKSIRDKG